MTRTVGQDIDIDLAVTRAIDQILTPPETLEIKALIQQLRSADGGMRIRAAKELAKKGPKADAAVADLVNLLQDRDPDARRAAVAALRAIEPRPKHIEAIVQAYMLDLQDPDDSVRLQGCRMLGRIGPMAAPAIPLLQRAVDDPDPDVRRAATDAMNRIEAH